MKHMMVVVVVLVLVGSTIVYGNGSPTTYSWHQKMTVEVEVDGKMVAGSSVVEMTVTGIPEERQFRAARKLSMRGEATVVKLPGDRYLFTLLTYDVFLTGKVFHDLVGDKVAQPEKGWAKAIRHVRERRTINQKDYPLLVTFTDINDPTTVRVVDPENLAAIFGPGVTLKRITLEITDEPVTEGKIEQFGFIGVLKKQGTLSGLVMADKNHPEPVNYLTSKAFKIGGKK